MKYQKGKVKKIPFKIALKKKYLGINLTKGVKDLYAENYKTLIKEMEDVHCWWECKLIQPLRRAVWRFLKKLKIELPYDPAIPLLGIYPEKTIIQDRKSVV